MVEDNPKMNELEELYEFAGGGYDKYEIYIYNCGLTQKMISKYLYYAKIKIKGFIMSEVRACDIENEPFPIVTLASMQKKIYKKRVRVIISSEDGLYNQIIRNLKMVGIDNYFIVSEWNKRTICKKMFPRSINDFWLEVNLADHCNLNCQCCDHFSPIASKTFLDFDNYVNDIQRLSQLTGGKIGLLKLQGGEPLLNDRLIDYIEVTRQFFPDSHICIFTDGLLLPKWGEYTDERKNLWVAVKKYEIEIRMTQYPIPLQLDRITKTAQEYGVPVTYDPPAFEKGARLWIFSEIGLLSYRGVKHSVKHPFDLTGSQDKFRFISCYQFNESIVLRDGKIYTCPMIPYAHYFNEKFGENLIVQEDCFIDIYKAQTFEEIAEFCTHRTSFCNYCAVHKRFSMPWRQSEHDKTEWVL